MKERNMSLDAMKGFAILLVMIGHIISLNEISDLYLYHIIEAVQMPIFMMLNGYICGFKLPVENSTQWRNVISKRAVAYVVPFFTWLLLKQWDNLIEGFKNTMFQLDRGLWFLMTLFILNVVLYTVQLLSTNFRKKGKIKGFFALIIMVGMATGIFAVQYIFHISFLSPELTLKYISPFIIGYLIRVYKDDLAKRSNTKLQFIIFIISIVIFIYLCVRNDVQSVNLFHTFIIPIIEGLIGCYIIFYLFLKSQENIIKEKLAWLGQYTLEIYVIHFHFATILNRGKLDFGLYSINGVLFVASSFIVMSVITAAFIYLAKQVPITNFLLFGKKKSRHKDVNFL
jgi:fucose 4-O-acetylase-like acetyltransferase